MITKLYNQQKLWHFLILIALSIFVFIALTGCGDKKNSNQIKFATNATYPPFEFVQKGKIVGFDIDLANMVAAELGKEAVIEDMQFQNILPSIDKGQADAAIATLTINPERKQNFDFSIPYYFETLAVVFPKDKPITDVSQMANKKASCQIATTMEMWLKKHSPKSEIMAVDDNNQAIESLKAGHVDFVMIDGIQAIAFTDNNPNLDYKIISISDDGYGIALKKNSPLTVEINQALTNLIANGKVKELEKKWFK
jgi:polar amino acid transport system substrate-binding protein